MFIPRHPVIENQFCSYAEDSTFGSTGAGGVVAYAGSVVYLDSSATYEEAMVKKMEHNSPAYTPFGFLMQKVKVGYHSVHPTGFVMPGDLGSSDAIAQAYYNASGEITGHKSVPVGIAHLGIYDTVHYICESSGGTVSTNMSPGDTLYAASYQARVTNNSSTGADASGDTGTAAAGTTVGRVVKGASTEKCQANMDNTTLYPIRIKLLV